MKVTVSIKHRDANICAEILNTFGPRCTKANKYSAISTAINGIRWEADKRYVLLLGCNKI